SRMRRLAEVDAPVGFSAAASSGYDSNVAVLPDGSRSWPRAGDGFYGADAALSLRGEGGSAAFARVGLGTRRYLELTDYDITSLSPSVGWRWKSDKLRAEVEYRYGFAWLSDMPFCSIHSGRAALEYTQA